MESGGQVINRSGGLARSCEDVGVGRINGLLTGNSEGVGLQDVDACDGQSSSILFNAESAEFQR